MIVVVNKAVCSREGILSCGEFGYLEGACERDKGSDERELHLASALKLFQDPAKREERDLEPSRGDVRHASVSDSS